jgi:hypothetical protein
MTDTRSGDIERHRSSHLREHALAGLRELDAVRAPASLHRSIAELTNAPVRGRRARRRRPLFAGAGALAAAAVAAVALVLGAGAARAPTVLEVSRLSFEPARLAAPAESAHRQGTLDAAVEGVSFPYWGGWRGWRTAGARVDHVGGRTITTVFYADRGGSRRIGYAIVAGGALEDPAGGAYVDRAGIRFHVLTSGNTTVVTWRERGHTCVLGGRGVPAHALLGLLS